MNILVINGPNLNLLGTRQPEIYGTETLEELMAWLSEGPAAPGNNFRFFQSNHEGDIIDTIHRERTWADGILINPGAFAHYSYAIRDAISAVGTPAVEVHLTDIHQREEFRKRSVIVSVCIGQVSGLGKKSYLEGLKNLLNYISD
ncbi:MAG: type II 3-dehydroquinate dehydratase [Candidatus Neomarinimicrobiota bacterium]